MAIPIAAAVGLGSALLGMFGKKKPKQEMPLMPFQPYQPRPRAQGDEIERLMRIKAMLAAMGRGPM